MRRGNKKGTRPIITEIGLGLITAIIVSIVFAVGVSFLIMNDTAGESSIKYFSMPIQLLAAFWGALLAGKRASQKYAIVCGCVGASYCFILLAATIMFFKSSFSAVGLGIGMCAAGTVAACAICMMKKGRSRKPK